MQHHAEKFQACCTSRDGELKRYWLERAGESSPRSIGLGGVAGRAKRFESQFDTSKFGLVAIACIPAAKLLPLMLWAVEASRACGVTE
jgi:hypothetical protein